MNRITIKTLRSLCDALNRQTGSPLVPWLRVGERNVAQIGCYIIDCAYGGYQLARIMNEGGGQTSPLGLGFGTARELYDKIHAYMQGMEDAPSNQHADAVTEALRERRPFSDAAHRWQV